MRSRALALFLVWLCASSARGQQEELQLNFRDAQPAAVVEAVARATGKRFVLEPQGLHGTLTIALEDKVSPAEAFEILNAALLTIGFAPVPLPSGGYEILPIEAAKSAAPWIHRSVSEESERLVTTMVRLQSANAADLAKLLVPPDRSSLVIPYAPTNSLIISAAEDRIAHILDLLRAFDQAAASGFEVLPLRWADAGTVASQLDVLFDDEKRAGPALPYKVTVDPRTNSLIVTGAPQRLHEIRKYTELVDVPKRSKGKVHVVRVLNADAGELAQQLSSISLDDSHGPIRGAGTGGAALASLSGKSFSVVADEPTNSLLISADAITFDLLAEVIAELDRIPPRVAIEVTIWSVETTQALDLGFDAILPLIVPQDAGDVVAFAAFGNPAPLLERTVSAAGPFLARFTRPPILVPIIGPDGTPTTIVAPGGGAEFTAAAGEATLRILSTPYLLAASGEEQHIFSGNSVPVPTSGDGAPPSTGSTQTGSTVTPGFVPSGFVTQQSIARQDVGVDLRVKPVSLSEHMTLLEVAVEVSDVAKQASTTGDQGPTLNQLKLEATVRLADGAVMLLASAPRDTTETVEEKAPWLGDIPILGWLFKATSDRVVRRRLVVTVQATQLHSPSEERAEQMERVLALQRRNQRTLPLRELTTEPYALLVATRDTREAATKILSEIADLKGDALVIEWLEDEQDPVARYDVYLAGFREISDLGNEAVKLRERGFTPRLEIAGDPQP